MHTARRRGRGQHRILYWFRTPPGVRVGRAAIDEEAIHLLEQHNPDVQFDWTRILKQPASNEPQMQELPRTSPRGRQEPPRSQPAPHRSPSSAHPGLPVEVVPQHTPVEEPSPSASADASDQAPSDIIELPTAVPDDPAMTDVGPDDHEGRQTAAFRRLGSEGLARLRARYAEMMARITDRPLEEPVREELKSRAERLNPDAWVTDDEVQQGLEQYESVFEGLRSVVGHPRRRRRRRG